MSSRGVRVADVLSREQVNEIADAPAGVLPSAVELANKPKQGGQMLNKSQEDEAASNLRVGSPPKDSKVVLEEGRELKEFVR